MGLFAQQHFDEQDIKHVQSQLHVHIALVENSKQILLEIAHQSEFTGDTVSRKC